MIAVARELSPQIGDVSRACDTLAVPRSTFYRAISPQSSEAKPPAERAQPPNALSSEERQEVLDHLHSDRFVDKSPAQAFHTLLDEGVYLASVRTYYRILASNNEVCERRAQRRHVQYNKPELMATAPNQVYTWDITKLKGPAKWVYYYLYVVLDIFSRYVVGWMLATRESGDLAKQLLEQTYIKQNIDPHQLTIHSDRGPAMQSLPVVSLHAKLGITKSNSRPHVSNDNPFSEAQFKTLKYQPEFPRRFGCYEDALSFCRGFFPRYNSRHHHSAILYLTPEMVHYGQADEVLAARHKQMMLAYHRNPERFRGGPPKPQVLERAVYINPPENRVECSLN
jgi:putative transposase